MERVPVAAVFDTGPLIYLDALGYLGVACGLLRIVVPDAVSGELARRPEAFGGGVPSLEGVERRIPAEEDMRGVSSGSPSIGAGESEVIAVALGMGAVAVIDTTAEAFGGRAASAWRSSALSRSSSRFTAPASPPAPSPKTSTPSTKPECTSPKP